MQALSLPFQTMKASEWFLIIMGYLFLLFLIFIVIREIVTWYWKQTRVVMLLEEIRDLLRIQVGGVPIENKLNLVPSHSLRQPLDVAMLMWIFGGVIMVGGAALIVAKHYWFGVAAFGLALTLLIPAGLLERKRKNVKEEEVVEEEYVEVS